MIKTFAIFFLLLSIGYFVFNYIKDEKGIGFQKVSASYIVQLRPDFYMDTYLTMNKDGTYVFKYCSTTKGNYEIISGVYNFKILNVEQGDTECKAKDPAAFNSFRGKFITNVMDNGIIKLSNDNSDEFYLVPDTNPQAK